MTVDVHHELSGPADGPVVLLANSLGSDLSMWEPQAAALVEAGFRVVRYDQRGHGRSPVPAGMYTMDDLGGDAVALLDRLGVHRASVVGVSMGGMVAMWLGQHAPERVERLVLCCTSAELGPASMWDDRIEAVGAGGVAAVADAVTQRWLTPETRAQRPELARWLHEMLTATPAEGYAGCCAAIRDMDLLTGLRSISAATLVISGDADPSTPPEHGRRIADGIPGARFEVVPGVAHLGNLEKPARFAELILAHLQPDPFAAGMAVRRATLGEDHVDRALGAASDFTRPFQDYITASVWGSIWSRPGLDRRTRSCITVAVLAALRAHEELALHVRAAIRNGVTREEISEILLHVAGYAGAPAANSALAIAERVLDTE
ncbi:MAG: 3-oxoadipate enol-lactonase [Geodermatophilaceae bacterium]